MSQITVVKYFHGSKQGEQISTQIFPLRIFVIV